MKREKSQIHGICFVGFLSPRHVALKAVILMHQEILYYFEMGKYNKFRLHWGDETGQVIATGIICREKRGSTNIQMIESSRIVNLEHTPRRLLLISPKTTFSINGHKYRWIGDSNVFENKTNCLVGQYYANLARGEEDKIGTLLLREGKNELTHMVVISALVLQARSIKHNHAVFHVTFLC